jgi:hypothetical protein
VPERAHLPEAVADLDGYDADLASERRCDVTIQLVVVAREVVGADEEDQERGRRDAAVRHLGRVIAAPEIALVPDLRGVSTGQDAEVLSKSLGVDAILGCVQDDDLVSRRWGDARHAASSLRRPSVICGVSFTNEGSGGSRGGGGFEAVLRG